MQNIVIHYPVNPFELLFIDKGLELLYNFTIDTYRLRLHNPKTLIEELISVCHASNSGLLTNNDYASSTSKELKAALEENNHGLKFIKVSKKHYIDTLSKASPKDYSLLIQSSKLMLKDNQHYLSELFDEILRLTAIFPSLVDDHSPKFQNDLAEMKKNIIVLANHLFVELINKGFTKQYLNNFFQITFVRNIDPALTFSARMDILKTLIVKDSENFTVIFRIIGSSFQFNEFKKIDNSYELVTKRYRRTIAPVISAEVADYLEDNKENFLIYIEIKAHDYFKAVETSMNKLSKDMDIYHLGFTRHSFKIDTKCAVIGKVDPSKADTFPSNFQIDGYVRSNAQVFETLLNKIKKIEQNSIEKESYDKIISAIRYFRTGTESPELETKLLNYWIGLEYIFTSNKNDQKTIDRIRSYYPLCHSLIYVKRNLHDLHKTIKRLGISAHIPGYNDDLVYLSLNETYDAIVAASPSELLKVRARYYQTWVQDPSRITYVLHKHTTNLEWNLTRLYRIRNEIVHNAAIKKGIYVHISHMKYYFTFILNSILDFMAEVHADLDNDGKVSIEDYFIAQSIMLGSLRGQPAKEYLKVDNPSQIFH
ncbi:hypothetical protein LPB86_09955 [Pedobacter sp. MC2016-14]|uniref:hypothetical protein n=1 Tax=Pedobacter sp. MC2016-14 TaxID=2897327 RepID=UPI001E3DBFB1|nr:hypothetical protein [Pedobacter sp. MC2016-14]MCD0488555.1 hypothetical protein [Pedobacter sp. MC2016-14]